MKATVLLYVPYETENDDVEVSKHTARCTGPYSSIIMFVKVLFERNYLVAGVKGQPPVVKVAPL